MDESRQVIFKVKYQSLNNQVEKKREIETQWDVRKIGVAVLLLIVFILTVFYVINSLFNEESIKLNKQGDEGNTLSRVLPVINNVIRQDVNDNVNAVYIKDKIIKSEVITASKERLGSSVITVVKATDSRIVRALLTTGMEGKEPVNVVKKSLSATRKKAVNIFYFTELVNMKGQYVYHYWLRGKKLIRKKKIKILGQRWRAATSKLINFSRVGVWRVRLVNQQGLVLNEIQFKVEQG